MRSGQAGRLPPVLPAPDESSHLNILIADDDAVSGVLAAALLRRLGLPPPVVARSAAGLPAGLAEGEFDLLLLHAELPGLDAADRAPWQQRLDAGPAPPLCVDLVAAGAPPPGASRCIAKPLQREALQALIETLDVDLHTRDELTRLFGARGVAEMLAVLARDLLAQRQQLAAADGDAPALARIAHRLRGAALQLGAQHLARHAAHIEHGPQDDPARSARHLQRVLSRFETLVGTLERTLEP